MCVCVCVRERERERVEGITQPLWHFGSFSSLSPFVPSPHLFGLGILLGGKTVWKDVLAREPKKPRGEVGGWVGGGDWGWWLQS